MVRQRDGYHSLTRWLHAALALGVIFQLVCAGLMVHPEHEAASDAAGDIHDEGVLDESEYSLRQKDDSGEAWMRAHRSGGVVVAIIVLTNLLWAVVARGNPKKRQITVLFSIRYWQQARTIARQFPLMLAGRQPLPEPGNALSLVTEMLGLLTMTAMAVSGYMIWNLWAGPDYTVSEIAEFWVDIHAGFAILLLLYLVGHVSMAMVYASKGDPVFTRIIPWRRRYKADEI